MQRWIREIVRRVQEVPIPKEIILVDDFAEDGTREILDERQQAARFGSFTTR